MQVQEQLTAARAQLSEQAAAATAAAANLELLRERCARLEADLADAHAAAEAAGERLSWKKIVPCTTLLQLQLLTYRATTLARTLQRGSFGLQ